MSTRLILSLAMVILGGFSLLSCSGGSGSWDDDAQNWSRAFGGQKQPAEVKVTHSRYWKSPHFTYEAEYFFEFTTSPEFLEAWISSQKLVPASPAEKNTPLYFHKPDWFTPKRHDDYNMWLPADDPMAIFAFIRINQRGLCS